MTILIQRRASIYPRLRLHLNVYEYLCKEANRITESSLTEVGERRFWADTEAERRRIFADMLGLAKSSQGEKIPVKPVITGVLDR